MVEAALSFRLMMDSGVVGIRLPRTTRLHDMRVFGANGLNNLP